LIRIGLISDTHGHLDERILIHFKDCDEIWHAGDIGTQTIANQLADLTTLRAVYGNIDTSDIQTMYPENLIFQIEKIKVWITHIGGYPPRYNKKIKSQLSIIRPGLFICGHSHILRIIPDKKLKLLHINPGAAGHQGFHKIRSIVRFSIAGGQIEDLQVIELGRRGY
jgi:putative phosphoesterase